MSRTYCATGINLKSMPLGESDRLLTILTREHGLVQAVAMGSRKHNSSLTGRSGLFVVNDLLIVKGRSLDKIAQAETLESYPGLGQDLKKLTASQYLAELSLWQALSDQPQEALFFALNQHLKRLEESTAAWVLPHLIHAILQLLTLAGLAPQVYRCCMTGKPLVPMPDDPEWRIGFSSAAGGAVTLEALAKLRQKGSLPLRRSPSKSPAEATDEANPHRQTSIVAESESPRYPTRYGKQTYQLNREITATELTLLQTLVQTDYTSADGYLTEPPLVSQLEAPVTVWLSIERILQQYAQYHFDRPIRSAALIDACFLPSSSPLQPSEP